MKHIFKQIESAAGLARLTEGRFTARYQFCKVESIPIAAVDAAHAWAHLAKRGCFRQGRLSP